MDRTWRTELTETSCYNSTRSSRGVVRQPGDSHSHFPISVCYLSKLPRTTKWRTSSLARLLSTSQTSSLAEKSSLYGRGIVIARLTGLLNAPPKLYVMSCRDAVFLAYTPHSLAYSSTSSSVSVQWPASTSVACSANRSTVSTINYGRSRCTDHYPYAGLQTVGFGFAFGIMLALVVSVLSGSRVRACCSSLP